MIEVANPSALQDLVGTHLGSSDWVLIDQPAIDRFAAATGDHNWYHVDVARAARDMPGGKTIAHGLLLQALVPALTAGMVLIQHRGRALNYGADKVRYLTPVQAGDRVRLHVSLKSAEMRANGMLMNRLCSMEIEGTDKPAMVGDFLTLVASEPEAGP